MDGSPLMRAASWRPSALFASSVRGAGGGSDDDAPPLAEAQLTESEELTRALTETESAARDHLAQTIAVILSQLERRFRSELDDIVHKERRAVLNRFAAVASEKGLEAAAGVAPEVEPPPPEHVLLSQPWKTPVSQVRPILKRDRTSLGPDDSKSAPAILPGRGGGVRRQLLAMRVVDDGVLRSTEAEASAEAASSPERRNVKFSKFLHIVPIPPREHILHEDLESVQIVPYGVEGDVEDDLPTPYDAELATSESDVETDTQDAVTGGGNGGKLDGHEPHQARTAHRRMAKDAPLVSHDGGGKAEASMLHDVLRAARRRGGDVLAAALGLADASENESDADEDFAFGGDQGPGDQASAGGNRKSISSGGAGLNRNRSTRWSRSGRDDEGSPLSPLNASTTAGGGGGASSLGRSARFASSPTDGRSYSPHTFGELQTFNAGYADGTTVFGLRKDSHIARKSFRHMTAEQRQAALAQESVMLSATDPRARIEYVAFKEDRECFDREMQWLRSVMSRRGKKLPLKVTHVLPKSADPDETNERGLSSSATCRGNSRGASRGPTASRSAVTSSARADVTSPPSALVSRAATSSQQPRRERMGFDARHRMQAPWLLTTPAPPPSTGALMLQAELRDLEDEPILPPTPYWDGWTEPDSLYADAGFRWSAAPPTKPRVWRAAVRPDGFDARSLQPVLPGAAWRDLAKPEVERIPSVPAPPKGQPGCGADVELLAKWLETATPWTAAPGNDTTFVVGAVRPTEPPQQLRSMAPAVQVPAQPRAASKPVDRGAITAMVSRLLPTTPDVSRPHAMPSEPAVRAQEAAAPRRTPRNAATRSESLQRGTRSRKTKLFEELEALLSADTTAGTPNVDSRDDALVGGSEVPATLPPTVVEQATRSPRAQAPQAVAVSSPTPPSKTAAPAVARFVPRASGVHLPQLGVAVRELDSDGMLRRGTLRVFTGIDSR